MSENERPAVATAAPTPFLSNKTYDWLKFLAQVIFPGLGALYFTCAAIWGLPKAEEVVGTITALDLFLGLFLARQTTTYNASDAKYDGAVELTPDVENDTTDVRFDLDPQVLADNDTVVLKVSKTAPTEL
jgi:hypothetical protein